jgi:myo-inositol catabolism protein IolC
MSEKLNTLSHKLIRYKIEENIGCALNLWTQIFLIWVYAFWHPMHLQGLRANEKLLQSTIWIYSSTCVIKPNYYVFHLLWCFFAYSHFKIFVENVYIYKWRSLQGYSKWCRIIQDSCSMTRIRVQHFVLSIGKTVFTNSRVYWLYTTFVDPMLIFSPDIDTRIKYWLLSDLCYKLKG